MTDRFIGASGVHDWTVCTTDYGLSGSRTFSSVGWSCRLASLVACSSSSISSTLFSILQHRRLVELFTKVRTFLIEVDLLSCSAVLCSTIVYTQHPLDNCSSPGLSVLDRLLDLARSHSGHANNSRHPSNQHQAG